MPNATGDPRSRRIQFPTTEHTAAVRAALERIKPLAQCSSRGVSTGEHVNTRFQWDVRDGDATPDQVAAAREALAALPRAGSIQVGPWGGEVVRRVR